MSKKWIMAELTIIIGAIMAIAGAWLDNDIGMFAGAAILILGIAASETSGG